MNPEQSVIDSIDALIDEQLDGGEPIGGYDYDDPDYPECWRCEYEWHGLPLLGCPGSGVEGPAVPKCPHCNCKWHIEPHADHLPCNGSTFIGPRPPTEYEKGNSSWAMLRLSRHPIEIPDGAPYAFGLDVHFAEGGRIGWASGDGVVHVGRVESHEPDGHGGWTITVGADLDGETDRDIESFDTRPRMPRPSTTPPMWTVNPARARRVNTRRRHR